VIALTRRYRFPAAHVLALPEASEAENRRIYGKCANPAGHGHDYGVEVTVAGPVDERTGRVIDPARLDALYAERVGRPLSHRMLNEAPLFAERGLVPTAENVARVVFDELAGPVAACGEARLLRVRIVETRRNSFAYGEIE
jgi:6-pyruvoyltetrahydropterin/6-carboxytetrahydropterin synthase